MVKLILIFISGLTVGGMIIWLIFKLWARDKKMGLIEKQKQEKERNKEAILGILETQTPLTNNHIEQLLGISDATATRYLEELEKEGVVRQVGNTGSGVYYERTN